MAIFKMSFKSLSARIGGQWNSLEEEWRSEQEKKDMECRLDLRNGFTSENKEKSTNNKKHDDAIDVVTCVHIPGHLPAWRRHSLQRKIQYSSLSLKLQFFLFPLTATLR